MTSTPVFTKIKLSRLVRATKAAPPDADGTWLHLQTRLSERRRARATRRIVSVPLLALAAAAAFAPFWIGRAPTGQLLEVGHPFESDAKEVSMALPDGIRLDLGRHSRVGITKLTAEEIRVALGLGYARFDVDRRPPRTFVVDVEDVEVRVVGTRFQVERVEGDDREGARVEVSVQRGVVEVRSRREGGELHRLTAGQRFSTPLDPFAEDAVAAPAEAARSAAEGAGGVAGEDGAARPARVARDRARLLFERAQERWRAGRMGDAAAYYEEVLARHPNDPRAGLAALELGRIRMDHLDDLPGAVVSLERAVRLAPSAPFHEDALARLAQANARLGRASECRRARDAYLARYPEGIHAAAVSGACDRGGGSGRR